METLARRIRRLHIRIAILNDRLKRAKTAQQAANLRRAIEIDYRQMYALAVDVDLEGAGIF